MNCVIKLWKDVIFVVSFIWFLVNYCCFLLWSILYFLLHDTSLTLKCTVVKDIVLGRLYLLLLWYSLIMHAAYTCTFIHTCASNNFVIVNIGHLIYLCLLQSFHAALLLFFFLWSFRPYVNGVARPWWQTNHSLCFPEWNQWFLQTEWGLYVVDLAILASLQFSDHLPNPKHKPCIKIDKSFIYVWILLVRIVVNQFIICLIWCSVIVLVSAWML